jgi:hypothetical protein
MDKLIAFLGTIVFAFLAVAAVAAFMSLPVMLLWDWLMPTLFGLTTITWFQAWGLMFLSGLLFKPTIKAK